MSTEQRWWARSRRPTDGESRIATKAAVWAISLAAFVLALELMKAGARDVAPLFHGLVEGDATTDALGVGWLAAYVVLSGSPVAAAALTLLDGAVLTQQQALAMIAGSRLGASMAVVLLGVVWLVRGRGSRQDLATGLLAMVVTATIQLPALVVGLVAIEQGLVPPIRVRIPVLDVPDRVFGPVVDAAGEVLPGIGLFVLGTVVVVASFNLFDRALPSGSIAGDQLSNGNAFRPAVMFLAGLAVTALTMSVSVSIGVLVPLTARGVVRRENVVPYVMGCNVSTFIDTLFVALLLQDPDGLVVVLVAMVSVAAVSLLVLAVGFTSYQRRVDALVTTSLRTRRGLAVTMGVLVAVPALLVVL